MIIFYSLGVFILLLVDLGVQHEGGSVLPGLMRVGEEDQEGGDQKTWTLKDEGLDNFLGPPVLDDAYAAANLGGDAVTVAADDDDDDDGKPTAAQVVVQGCQVDDSSRAPNPNRNRRRQNSDKPLLCPAQLSPPNSQQEEKKPRLESGSQSSEDEKPDPWQFENQERGRQTPQFSYNNGICTERDYGSLRVIPVCDSGIDFFSNYNSISKDYNVRDVRPCRSKHPQRSPPPPPRLLFNLYKMVFG